MKNLCCLFACCFFCLGFQSTLLAQKTATWKGGTPGSCNDWNCAQNWKEGRVPNEFSDVVIPDVSTTSGFQPIIRSEVESINSLTVLSGAFLRIEKTGSLQVFDSVGAFATGSIQNSGVLHAPNNPISLGKSNAPVYASNHF